MKRLLICVLCTLPTVTDVAAAPAGKPGKDSRVHSSQQAGKSKLHRQVARLKAAAQRAQQVMRKLEQNVALARNAEQSVRRRYADQSGSQARNIIRRATLERANLENQLTDASQSFANALANYNAAKGRLHNTRDGQWRTAAKAGAKASKRGRKLTYAGAPLGPTGSGSTRPTKPAKGILKRANG